MINRIRALCFVGFISLACSNPRETLFSPGSAAPSAPQPPPATETSITVINGPAGIPEDHAATSWPFLDARAPDLAKDAAKKPFSIDALYELKSIADVQWSPDGTRILFTVTEADLRAGKSNTDIYSIREDGSDLLRLTSAPGTDHHPRWHPDGKSFLFVSSRSGEEQVWQMSIGGGEPRQLTTLGTGTSDPEWSPDGTKIAFASQVFPKHGADDAANRAATKARSDNPIQAHLADHLLYRHWSSYADGLRTHVLVHDLASNKTIDVTPGDFDSPAFSLGDIGFAWAPDSKELCFVSNREAPDAQSWTTNKDLFVVPATGGNPTNLTANNKAYDGYPVYSPDGRYIAFLRQEKPGFEADRFRLALLERKTKKVTVLTERFDAWVMAPAWTHDSASILFRAPVHGRFPLFKLDVTTAQLSRFQGIPTVEEFSWSSKGQLAFTTSGIADPVELYVGSKGADTRRLTSFNRSTVDKYDFRPVEELWLPGADGTKVHTWVIKPHGYTKGKKYPTVVNIHGGPQYQWADKFRGDPQIYPAAGYVNVFPNPRGSIGYGQAYTDAISKDWGGKVYTDVMTAVDALTKLDYVDGDRLGAMGWSYGGYFINWALGHTTQFKAMASMMGVFDLRMMYGTTEELWFTEWDLGANPWDNPEQYEKHSPSLHAKNFKTPTLIITGEKDYRVPYTQSLALFTSLRRQDIPARLIVFPNDGHWPSWVKSMPLYYAAHLDWFHRYLGGAKSPYDPAKLVEGTAFR